MLNLLWNSLDKFGVMEYYYLSTPSWCISGKLDHFPLLYESEILERVKLLSYSGQERILGCFARDGPVVLAMRPWNQKFRIIK